jgi:peptide/nickel transport system substrate-binding protein
MKTTRFMRAVAGVAAAAMTITGLAAVAIAPASAATRSTVIIGEGVGWDSLNPAHPDHNSAVNADIAYLTNFGFWYYDEKPKLVRNTTFGTYDQKMSGSTFVMTYKIKPGRVWSDGTPIDAVDLLLSHVVSSSAYSIKAGLGDPSSADGSKFVSGAYTATYDNNVIGNPVLSDNNMTLTIKFKKYLPSWEVTTPGASPVHALEAMADGKKALQSAAANKAYKAKFLSDYTKAFTGDAAAQARMAKMGKIWSEDYHIAGADFDATSNPLLVVGNGPFLFKSYNKDASSETLVVNPKYNSGPAMKKTNPIKTIVFKYVADGTASVQALQNGDINVYQGAPGVAGYSTLQTLASGKKVGLIGGSQATYEHVDLRVGNGSPTDTTDYNGPFAASRGQKAKDLRLAFLLAFPRYNAVQTQIKPFNAKGTYMNSSMTLPGSKYYNTAVKVSGITANKTITIGSTKYTYNFNVTSQAQQDQNVDLALKIVQKYYPDASATKSVVKIKMVRSSREMRVQNNALIVASAAKAGFEVSNATTPSWSSNLKNNDYDVAMFAWAQSAITQDGSNANFRSTGSNNNSGWFDTTLDGLLDQLENKGTDAQIGTLMGKVDKIISDNAWSLPMYQWVSVTAYSTGLKGIKPSAINPTAVWNVWEWSY